MPKTAHEAVTLPMDPAGPRFTPTRLSAIALASLALTLGACGGDDPVATTAPASTTPTVVAGCELNGTTGGEAVVLPGDPNAPEQSNIGAPFMPLSMGDAGLGEVTNPSALFLDTSGERAAGAAVFAGIEGSRPVLVEFQALVSPSAYGTPRRAVVGWDSGRLAMVLAVLESRCGLSLGNRDVYLNVAGGLRVSEPAADLAAAAALASSALDQALPQDCVVFGEISLSGDIRPVSRMEGRMKEAAKLGFKRVLGPKDLDGGGMKIHGVTRLADAIGRIGENQWE